MITVIQIIGFILGVTLFILDGSNGHFKDIGALGIISVILMTVSILILPEILLIKTIFKK